MQGEALACGEAQVTVSPRPSDAHAVETARQARPEPSETRPTAAICDPTAPIDPAQAWPSLRAALRKRMRHEQFETWFRCSELRRCGPSGVAIAVQNAFSSEWLRNHYLAELERVVLAVFGARWPVTIEVDAELTLSSRSQRAESATDAAPPDASAAEPSKRARAAGRSGDNGLLWTSDVALNPGYRFETFVVGPCNRFAHAASVGVSENPGSTYNPFFLHGSVGLGKTHLLQSLCYALLDRAPRTRILYLSCETFINHFINALGNGDLERFRTKYRNVDVLVVDDIHMLANKERTQEEFFHTFNTLYNAGKQIVLSSDSSPKEIPTLQERLVSRFKWGLVTEIESPCFETRVAILKRKSRERGREIPDAVAQLVAEHVDTNIREIEGAVNRLIGYAALSGQEITPDLARHVLRDAFTAPRSQPSMEDILRVVTAHFNVKVTDLQSRRRTKAIAHPRQIGMYLARQITRHSLEEIGGFYGGRDHTTVLYAVEQVDKQMRGDQRFRALIASFLDQLRP
jgi:chromosomal replication initiator protein